MAADSYELGNGVSLVEGLGPNDAVVAIGAHFDDLELGCGGVLAALRARGCPVTMLVLTASGYRYAGGGERRDDLAETEGHRAAAALGVDDVRCLGHQTLALQWEPELIGGIEAVLVETSPVLILTHWAFDSHQDHHYGCMATLSAARHFPTILMYEPIFPSGRSYYPFRPQIYFDIGSSLEAKMSALKRHESQFEKYGTVWTEAVEARARYRGYEAGVAYAEAFEVIRMRVSL